MKKNVLLVALILCCGFLFARELDVSFGHLSLFNIGDDVARTDTGIAFDANILYQYENSNVGILFSFSYGKPLTFYINENGKKDKVKASDVFDKSEVLNFGFGGFYVPYEKNNFKVYLAGMFNVRMEKYGENLDGVYGLGGFVSANYYFNDYFFATCKLKGAYDFLHLEEVDFNSTFMLLPSIGFGIRF